MNEENSRDDCNYYDSFCITSYIDIIYVALSHLKQGEIYKTLGQKEKAIKHYIRFVELWKECDSMFQPMLEQAKKRLELLTKY